MQNLKLKLIQTNENFQILDIFLENNGILSPEELCLVSLPHDIDWRKGIVVFGRAPIWLYSYLVHQAHPAAWVAVYDPRYGAVVVEAHKTNSPKVGDIIDPETILKYYKQNREPHKIIAFLGNPHTGKSVFLRVVRNKLKELLHPDVFCRDVFVVKACPDGEGDWFAELGENDGKIYRYKNRFDFDFADRISKDIEIISKEKTKLLVDCGGKIDHFNQIILNKCTTAIILGTDENSISEWRGAAKLCGLEILCEVFSSNQNVSFVVNTNPLRIKFGFLDRNNKNIPELPKEFINKLL